MLQEFGRNSGRAGRGKVSVRDGCRWWGERSGRAVRPLRLAMTAQHAPVRWFTDFSRVRDGNRIRVRLRQQLPRRKTGAHASASLRAGEGDRGQTRAWGHRSPPLRFPSSLRGTNRASCATASAFSSSALPSPNRRQSDETLGRPQPCRRCGPLPPSSPGSLPNSRIIILLEIRIFLEL